MLEIPNSNNGIFNMIKGVSLLFTITEMLELSNNQISVFNDMKKEIPLLTFDVWVSVMEISNKRFWSTKAIR